jgi:Na+/proline symporter
MGMRFIGIVFILGLIAAAYSSADGTLTALTTTIFVDFMNNDNKTEQQKVRTRKIIHILVSIAVLLTVIIFKYTLTSSAISQVLFVATLTYGPLLGMFAFGIITKHQVKDTFIPIICILSPIISYFVSIYSKDIFFGYQVGYELLAINGGLTYLGMWLVKR